MNWVEALPDALKARAYSAAGELAWQRDAAIAVISQLTALGYVIEGIEVWLATTPGPTIPAPFFYHWERPESEDSGSNDEALRYIATFGWDPQDTAHLLSTPYFNLEVGRGISSSQTFQ
jgi:hypothetical protein